MWFARENVCKGRKAQIKLRHREVTAATPVQSAALMIAPRSRSQTTVGDVAWMMAMIPHHSITILTGERANISDPCVRELADAIIDAQRGEIEEMKKYIADIQANGDAPAGTGRQSGLE